MNIYRISNTVGNGIERIYKRKEMSDFKNILDTVMKNAPKLDTYIPEEKLNGLDNSGVYNKTNGATESTTDSKVVVKADGSRVLMITINVNGMNTTMSLEISKPTQMPNSEGDQELDTTTLNAGNLQSVDSEL
ncbi:hypothetical protein EHV15_07355 [Paenibacillus oralis]|uniref:Uncharacterized protein n=1 Tax=Paenibacillus oralis TaxID=2490856 RepID=A0A3P3TYB5_9BACL|nr:hypothetical protein [Paenibacillus oralis]RRJ62774.1 hypothetical protein EHV15_07355 [Paenibacillus oralis]